MAALLMQRNRGIHRLQKALFIDACQHKAALIQSLGTFRRSADTNCRERMSHRGEEAGLLRQSSGVADHRKGIHLQAVIIMEAQRFMADDPGVKPETALLQPFSGAGMAGIQNRHIILPCQSVNRCEQRGKILCRVDILFPMGRQKDVSSLFQSQPAMDIGSANCLQILMQHLCHGRTGYISTLSGQTAFRQIPTGMLGVCHIDIGNNIHNPAVGFLRQTLILAAVACLHVENGNVQPLCGDGTQAGVGISQNQQRIGLQPYHQLIGAADDIAHGLAQIISHRIQIYLRLSQLQIPEKDAVEVIIIILTGMGKDAVKAGTAFFNHRRQTDNLRTGTHHNEQLQLAVILKGTFVHCTTSRYVSGR